MFSVVMVMMRVYVFYVVFLFVVVVGFVGYNFENLMGRVEILWKEESI